MASERSGAAASLPASQSGETAAGPVALGRAFGSPSSLAALLDHTLLKPEGTREQVIRLAEEAAEYRFACAMVNPAWVPEVVSVLRGTGVRTGTVIGFPLGASLTSTKAGEAAELAALGAHDLDMVVNIGWLRSGLDRLVADDIAAVVAVARDKGTIVKVILETCLLTEEEKRRASRLAVEAGADFLKTSTGFSTHGATPADVALLREMAGAEVGVKASGGIRTLADARAMVKAGANRIGASASVAIVQALGAELA
jgi:deoxyribose-phosphate aldolase